MRDDSVPTSLTTPSEVPDVLAPDLDVVFCGINPGRVSATARAHFANPRNDFWRLLHDAGLTPRLYEPHEQFELLELRVGLTNAAYRTTPGSGDLRRSDFADSARRLELVASELRPRWLAFVGKEAYRGVFSERPQLGMQERTLGETRLFVLPSTSPANAAVPYSERLLWFDELSARIRALPLREAVRAVVLDPDDRVLLVHFRLHRAEFWSPPGGGVEWGEDDAAAIARELEEEAGITEFGLGPVVWTREHWFNMPRWSGQRERHYLVRVGHVDVRPGSTEEQLSAEGVEAVRWWTLEEVERRECVFAPRRLPDLLREVIEQGPPAEPPDVGV
jgi:TDG/mug DNA glycosylase family protein